MCKPNSFGTIPLVFVFVHCLSLGGEVSGSMLQFLYAKPKKGSVIITTEENEAYFGFLVKAGFPVQARGE